MMTASPETANTATSGEFAVAQQLNESRKSLRRAAQRSAAGKEPEWASAALNDLIQLQESLVRHREGVRGPHCHYERLCLQSQWLIPRIQKLIARFDEVEFEAHLLGQKLGTIVGGESLLVQEARNDTTRLLADLRRTLTEESSVDLDSFNEPPALD
jgi:hypothetical protein